MSGLVNGILVGSYYHVPLGEVWERKPLHLSGTLSSKCMDFHRGRDAPVSFSGCAYYFSSNVWGQYLPTPVCLPMHTCAGKESCLLRYM